MARPEQTSPYKFYQFWLNLDDDTSEDMVKYYTLLDRDTIEALIERHRANPGARELQRTLAREVTELIHGTERCDSVVRVTDVLFGGADIAALSDADLDALGVEIPTVALQQTASQALVESQIVTSLGEARRLIAGNAVSINGLKISEDVQITETSLVKKGKNAFVLVR